MEHARIRDIATLPSFGNGLVRRGEVCAALPVLARARQSEP
jgi:hypothetical protein